MREIDCGLLTEKPWRYVPILVMTRDSAAAVSVPRHPTSVTSSRLPLKHHIVPVPDAPKQCFADILATSISDGTPHENKTPCIWKVRRIEQDI
jgi:hypothetical protein